jgi:hypothetical protein
VRQALDLQDAVAPPVPREGGQTGMRAESVALDHHASLDEQVDVAHVGDVTVRFDLEARPTQRDAGDGLRWRQAAAVALTQGGSGAGAAGAGEERGDVRRGARAPVERRVDRHDGRDRVLAAEHPCERLRRRHHERSQPAGDSRVGRCREQRGTLAMDHGPRVTEIRAEGRSAAVRDRKVRDRRRVEQSEAVSCCGRDAREAGPELPRPDDVRIGGGQRDAPALVTDERALGDEPAYGAARGARTAELGRAGSAAELPDPPFDVHGHEPRGRR